MPNGYTSEWRVHPQLWLAFNTLYEAGMPLAQIAARLNKMFPGLNISRQAVSGKAQRMGLRRELSVWSAPVMDRYTQLYAAGWSHSIIARRLNEEFSLKLTRAACIGRAHRLGLERRVEVTCKRVQQGLQLPIGGVRVGTQRRAKRMAGEAGIDLKPPEGVGVSMRQLRPFSSCVPTSCRYPIGKCEEVGEKYCGEDTRVGTSWCPYHHEVVRKGGQYASAA